MLIIQRIRQRFGPLLLFGGAGAALLGGLLLWVLPSQPWWLMALVRLIFAALVTIGLNAAIFSLVLRFDQPLQRHTWREDSSAMLWPQPVYDHLYRTRMPRELKALLQETRGQELAELESFLDGGRRMLVISGDGGLGKSSLAAVATRRVDFWLNMHFRDYMLRDVLFHLASWLEAPAITNRLLSNEDIDPCVVTTIIKLLSRDGRRLTFNGFDHLLDENGNFIDEELAEFFNALLAADGDHQLILCCRREPWFCRSDAESPASWQRIELAPLEKEGMQKCAEQVLKEPARSIPESTIRMVDGNPMILTILAPLAAADSPVLQQHTWRYPGDSLFDPDFIARLAHPDFSALSKAALMPEPLTKSFINSLQGEGAADAAKQLQARNLLIWDGGMKRYYIHPEIMRPVLESMPPDSEDRRVAFQELAAICLKKAKDFKAPDKWTGISDCRLYMHALGIFLRLGDMEQSAATLFKIAPFLEKWGHRLLLIRYLERLLHLFETADPAEMDAKVLIRVLKTLTGLYIDAGMPQQSLPLLSTLVWIGWLEGNPSLRSFAKGKKVESLLRSGDVSGARALAEGLIRSEENQGLLAAHYARLGHVLQRSGARAEAVNAYYQSSAIFKRIGQKQALLKSIEYLCEAYVGDGQFAHAHDLLEKLVAKESVRRDVQRYLKIQRLRASCFLGLGDAGKAILILNENVETAGKAGLPPFVISAHSALAKLYSDKDNLPAAMDHLEQMIEAAGDYGDFQNLAIGHARLAKLQLQHDKLEDAAEHVVQAIDLFSLCDSEELRRKSEALYQQIQQKAVEL